MSLKNARRFARAAFPATTLFCVLITVLTTTNSWMLFQILVFTLLIPIAIFGYIARRFWRCPGCALRLPVPVRNSEFNFCPYCRTKIEDNDMIGGTS